MTEKPTVEGARQLVLLRASEMASKHATADINDVDAEVVYLIAAVRAEQQPKRCPYHDTFEDCECAPPKAEQPATVAVGHHCQAGKYIHRATYHFCEEHIKEVNF